MAKELTYKNVSRLVRNADVIADLQALELDGGVIGFQWLGPHFLALSHYANYRPPFGDRYCSFLEVWMHLEVSASKCMTLRGEKEEQQKHYIEFLEIVVSYMPRLRDWFMLPQPGVKWFLESFIEFLLEAIGKLLSSGNDSGAVVMSGRAKLLLKDLEFLLSFLLDSTAVCVSWKNQSKTMMTEIEAAANEARLFLYSFFFTTQVVSSNEMDQQLSLLVPKIKDHCVAVSKMRCGIESLQVAEPQTSTSEISSSIPMAEEITVGLEDITTEILERLCRGPSYRQIISIVGMPGLGKTTLAKKLYNNANVQQYFDTRSWCVVSQSCKKRKLLMDILSSANNLTSEGGVSTMEDEELAEHLYKSLRGRRYLIIMDDLWDKNVLDDFSRLFPDVNNGSRVLFTSRQKNVASEASHIMIEPPPLSGDQCWDLLEKKVFKKGFSCPQDLQDIGKQIARNCQGIPLSVVTMAGVLSNMEMEKSLWQQVANSSSSYICQKSNDYISILKLSYVHLPNHLKKCFLYLCAFQEDEVIPVRELLFLWIAEGFIEQKAQKSLKDVAEEYLMELINRSLLQVAKRRSDNGVKTCTLHDLILVMCWKIAVEEEFLLEHQFIISKQLNRFFLDQHDCLPDAISILYNLEKTRILDFPSLLIKCDLETSILPNLSYLQTSSSNPSIGRFQNLVILVWKEAKDIPMYLLNMPKLRHLYAKAYSSIPTPRFSRECDIPRENGLQTLSFIYIFDSEDEEILKCSPKLRRLKCASPPNRFPDLNFLSQLESLTMKCRFELEVLPINFPTKIRKLTLSRIGLLWEGMSLIGKLPNLEVLKLEYDATKGEIWDTKDDEFQKLKFLKISDNDHLVKWNSSSDHFPRLERLVLDHCYKLEVIPGEFSNIPTLKKIELDYCSINVINSARQIHEEQQDIGNQDFELSIGKG